MAAFTTRTEKIHRLVWALALPTNMTEVSKTMAAITGQLEAEGASVWDNTVMVEADDDEMRFVVERRVP